MGDVLRELLTEALNELEKEFRKRRIAELPKDRRYFEALKAVRENKKLRKLLYSLSIALSVKQE